MKFNSREVIFAAALSCAAGLAAAGEIGGNAIVNIDMLNAAILSGTSDVTGGAGSTVQSILVEGKGSIKGDALLNVKMKNSLIVTNGGSTVQSIVAR